MDRLPTEDEVDDAVERWHTGTGLGMELREYLGWSWDDYSRWVSSAEAVRPLRVWPS
jgi:hypothetical protein